MKNIKYLFGFFGALAILFSQTSCTDWLDVNKSIDHAADPTYAQTLPLVVFYASQTTYDHAEYGNYLAQALTTGGRSQTGNYAYKAGWEFLSMNRHPQWRRHFFDIGRNIKELHEMAKRENVRNVILITRTIKLYSTMLTTDAFGDMPHSEVYEKTAPGYDTQESIYEWMYKEVDDLIALYADETWTDNKNPNNNNKNIIPKMDRLFHGDMAKWGAFTKALKARLLLRKLPNWDNTPETCAKIIEAVDAALNDPAYTDALYKYDGGIAEQNCPWGPAQPKLNLGWPQARENLLNDAIPSRFFAQAILGAYASKSTNYGIALDPRAEKLMTARSGATGSGSEIIRYLDNNIGMNPSMKKDYYPDLYTSGGSNPYARNDGYVALMTKEELLFIKAEAQYWKTSPAGRDPNNSGTPLAQDFTEAYETTKAAVELSLQRFSVGKSSKTEKRRYEKFMEIKLPGASAFSIADLMQQKYVSMYMQPEMWTDMRRYNYSSKTNGIAYSGHFVYTVRNLHDGSSNYKAENFKEEFSLTRPYNLYDSYWNTPENFGGKAKFSPNAWINRLNYDPETEEKYNRKELERLGAYKNPEWMKKRMIWAYKNNNYVTIAEETPWK